jgi:hypothetical protein
MIKCPKCGIEYSLGRKIYHSCEDFEICHGVIFEKVRISRPWNCNPIEKMNQPKVVPIKELNIVEKYVCFQF